ncbi:hypothetical protein ABWK22_02260 [Gottfriedia acidiceleris]|uniref:hypothetical protein n=1 Tax=Gottfriedia acidiceleris TaxID=371036 RepID=UPI0033991AE6
MKKLFKKVEDKITSRPPAYYNIHLYGFFVFIGLFAVVTQIINHEFKPFGFDYWLLMLNFAMWMIFRIEWYQHKQENKLGEKDIEKD